MPIISRGLYIFYLIFKDHFFVFKEVFSENSVHMYGLYLRAACNQERLMMARVRYSPRKLARIPTRETPPFVPLGTFLPVKIK